MVILELAKNFKYCDFNDEHRCKNASYYGGFQILDAALQSKLRSGGAELFKKVGSMFWKGNFNISKISFPIKCTAPLSILEIMPES